jgi:uncharacterized protein YeaO (DUF488 family)
MESIIEKTDRIVDRHIPRGPKIDDATIDNWFTYHPPSEEQQKKYLLVRETARDFAKILNALVPDSADKTAALRHLRETVLMANQAIACN